MQKYQKFQISNAQMSELLIESKNANVFEFTPLASAKIHAQNTLDIIAAIFPLVTESNRNRRSDLIHYENPVEVLGFLKDSGYYLPKNILENLENSEYTHGWIKLTEIEVKQIVYVKHRSNIALNIGIKKVSAAIYSNCDPKAMLVYEQMGGKWDSCGVWGLSPNNVAKIWYLAGCNNSPKFRMILAYEIRQNKKYGRSDCHMSSYNYVNKSSSETATANILRGLSFLSKRKIKTDNSYYHNEFTTKQIETIGRVSLPLRYALTTNCEMIEYSSIKERRSSHRGETEFDTYEHKYQKPILNFAYAAEVQNWTKAQKATLLSPKEAWFFLYGRCPFEGKSIPNPAPLASWQKGGSCFARLAQEFNAKGREDMLLPIFNLSALFGSYGEVKRFVKDWTENGIHDAGQFTLKGDFTPQKWAGFCHKYPEALKYSQLFGYIEKDCSFPTGLNDLKEKAATYLYEGATGFGELAKWCNHFNLSQSDFEDYKRLYSSEKTAESLPYVRIEIGDYTFSKLAHNDVRGALLGHFTSCCQHLRGAGAACARHGVIDPTSGFYIVEYKGKIVAQSWAWRSKKSDLVFDSIEALKGYDLNTISNLFMEAGQQMIGRLCIDRVLVGSTSYGLTASVRSFLQNEGYPCSNGLSEEMRSSCSYMDGKHQWLLTETGNKPMKFKKVELETIPQNNQLDFNRLVEGSGVYCEHCEAEVHPDCEICPICHENIAEWV